MTSTCTTPTQKNLFAQTVRAESHGCMRVQNPQELALVLLHHDQGWTQAKIDSGASTTPRTITFQLKTTYPGLHHLFHHEGERRRLDLDLQRHLRPRCPDDGRAEREADLRIARRETTVSVNSGCSRGARAAAGGVRASVESPRQRFHPRPVRLLTALKLAKAIGASKFARPSDPDVPATHRHGRKPRRNAFGNFARMSAGFLPGGDAERGRPHNNSVIGDSWIRVGSGAPLVATSAAGPFRPLAERVIVRP